LETLRGLIGHGIGGAKAEADKAVLSVETRLARCLYQRFGNYPFLLCFGLEEIKLLTSSFLNEYKVELKIMS